MALVVEVDHSLKIFLLVLEVAGLVYRVFLVVSSLHVLFDRLHRVCELDLNKCTTIELCACNSTTILVSYLSSCRMINCISRQLVSPNSTVSPMEAARASNKLK